MASVPQPDLVPAAFIQDIAAIVGAQHVLTEKSDVAAYFIDWRRGFPGTGIAVVRPANTGELSRVVALCAQRGIAIVPQAGNTSLCGGAVPTG